MMRVSCHSIWIEHYMIDEYERVGRVHARRVKKTLLLTLLMSLLVLLVSPSMVRADVQKPRSDMPRGQSGRIMLSSNLLPDLGQVRPAYETDNVDLLIGGFDLEPSHSPVIEFMLSEYRDRFQNAKSDYLVRLSALSPDVGDSEAIAAKQEAAAEELKKIRRDFQKRMREGEWEGDPARMKQAIDEATQSLVQQVIDLQQAKDSAVNYSQMFSDYRIEFDQWMTRRAEIEEQFESQLFAFLDDAQRTRWDAVRAYVILRNQLDSGLLAGEDLDLEVQLDRVLKDSPEEKKQAVQILDQWKRELAQLFLARHDEILAMGRLYLSAGSKADPKLWMDAARLESRSRAAIRDLTLSYVQPIADVLSQESSLAFQDLVYSTIFRSLYRTVRIFKSIKAAKAQRPKLDAKKLKELDALQNLAKQAFLERAVQMQGVILKQDMDNFVDGRFVESEQFFRRGSKPLEQIGTTGSISYKDIREWDASMMSRLDEIIGNARYSRLPGSRTSPARK